ncbi:MAG TPA: hypothetical protein VGD14_17290 [bacterium]
MRLYNLFSFLAFITFAVVGLIFLFIPESVLVFFNRLSGYLGMSPSSTEGINFYLILAVSYMYLVTLLAFLMYRHPENKWLPLLLIHGKFASSILSICLFLFHQPYLIYLTNFSVDGLIGIAALIFYLRLRRVAL